MQARLRDVGHNRWRASALLALIALTAGATGPAALAGSGKKARTLEVGKAMFWTGEHVRESGSEPDPLPLPVPVPLPTPPGDAEPVPNDCAEVHCIDYPLELVDKGAVLRVAIDTPDCQSSFDLELLSPDGVVEAQDTSCYSAEVYVDDPVKGTWIARVTPQGANEADFRMRAKLESRQTGSSARHRLLPNLRVEPPHEFTFDAPGGGVTSASTGCYEDEVVEDGAQRCLRFSVGPQNAGAGPLELKFARTAEVGTEASMYQRIYYSDGTSDMRDAGSSEFHKTHQHFHLKGFAKFELYRVVDAAQGSLNAAGTGHKSGFCLVDLRIAQWKKFNQQRAYSARSNCMPVGGKAELGLSAGWTDIYGYNLSGNYIDLGDNPDGRYVVRVIVDSLGHILESKENDNVGYAYINITGDSVTLLERGQGAGPWDPDRIVFDSW